MKSLNVCHSNLMIENVNKVMIKCIFLMEVCLWALWFYAVLVIVQCGLLKIHICHMMTSNIVFSV